MARKSGGGGKGEKSSFARQALDSFYANQHANNNNTEANARFEQSEAERYQQYYYPNSAYQPVPTTTHAAPAHDYHAAAMAYNPYGQGYNAQYAQYAAAPSYGTQYAQQAQQYDTPPQIRNPFAPPPTASSAYAAQNAGFDPDHEAQIAQWQAQYAPADQQLRGKKTGKDEVIGNANLAPLGQRGAATGTAAAETDKKEDKYTVVRKGGGEQWEDQSLLQWDPNKFRIMVGNLAGEVTDDSLAKAFAAYGVSKARVVRDKRTTKSKGFGFVEFEEGESGFKAAREMVGKYIGSHPVTIQRSKTDVRAQPKKDNNRYKGKNGRNNDKNKDKKKKNDNDPLKAHTGAGVEKKPSKAPAGLKLLG